MKAEVKAGAALLDERMPGWHQNLVDVKLVMQDACKCVLGVLNPANESSGQYRQGLAYLDLSIGDDDVQYGFSLYHVVPNANETIDHHHQRTMRRWRHLRSYWEQEIQARRLLG